MIAPRLRAIAERETGERLLPTVMKTWGIAIMGSEPRVRHNVLEEWKLSSSRVRSEIHKTQLVAEDWSSLSGRVLMTWSIFNPNGPTLSCIGLVDTSTPTLKVVFYRWLHPLHDQTFQLGFVDISIEDWGQELKRILEGAFPYDGEVDHEDFSMVIGVPSLVTHTFADADVHLPPHLLALGRGIQRADWGREMYYLRKYGSRLFDRAGEEIRESMQDMARGKEFGQEQQGQLEKSLRILYGHVPSFSDDAVVDYETKPFDAALFAEWWASISDPRFSAFGLGQLASAWVGAIHMTTLPVVVGFDYVREFLSRFQHPVWPDEFTTSRVKESMGLS